MKFADLFREKYRAALCAARANDENGTIDGLNDLYKLFASQYDSNNGDSIVIKAKRLSANTACRTGACKSSSGSLRTIPFLPCPIF